MEKQKNFYQKWWFWVFVIIGVLILFSLFSGKVKYQCQNGEIFDEPGKCPALQCPTCSSNIETKTVMKYQCIDGSIKEAISECPKQNDVSSGMIVLNGSDSQVTDKFYLNEGLVIFKNNYKGESNFAAWLVDENGNDVFLVANTIGTSDTSSSSKITNSGYYRLKITAWPGSRWMITIEQ